MDAAQSRLVCPRCGGQLGSEQHELVKCLDSSCRAEYPIVDGIPILIDELKSIFDVDALKHRGETYFRGRHGFALNAARAIFPSGSLNLSSKRHLRRLLEAAKAATAVPLVLVVGGSVLGDGMEEFVSDTRIQCVESDVSFGPRTALVCDAHSIPFQNETFDAVIVQAVLEHVVDPIQCVREIFRVLKADGLVYSEMPFMQQVHGREFDFTRLTHLGHRRLFRNFTEISSGAIAGPGTAFVWAFEHLVTSFAESPRIRIALKAIARIATFYIKYLDLLLIDKPGALDGASAYYFLGRKSSNILSDRDLVTQYRGAQR